MTFKQTMNTVAMGLKKHSPAIFTGVGIVGLGVTAVLAYKSRNKVEAVVEEIERQRDLEIPVNKMEVAKGLTEALYKPVVVGAASVVSILLAQKIQSNRIKTLIGMVVVEQARNIAFEKKYRKQHGDEEYVKFVATEEREFIEVDKKGKEKVTVAQVASDVDKSIGQWYSDSSEYFSDDHEYNLQFIDSVNERLQTIKFQRGTLVLNHVLDELGFDRLRNGAMLGWSGEDNFEIEKDVVMVDVLDENGRPTGEKKEDIYVSWTRPHYIYKDVDYNGRYSQN
jgi:hypothetical protein